MGLICHLNKNAHEQISQVTINLPTGPNGHFPCGGGRVVRRCWVNFQCWGVLLIWIIVGQGPIVLAVGAGGGCLDIFLSSIISLFFPI